MTILKELIGLIRNKFKSLPDSRSKKHRTYTIEDIAMSAYAMFYFQNSSWLDYQRNMQNRTGRNNAKSLFNIDKIPSDNHIRDTLDNIETKSLQPIFDKIYKILLKKEMLKEYEY